MRDCPFCDYSGPNEVLDADYGAYVIEAHDPVVVGHVLVIPEDHVADFTELKSWSDRPAELYAAARLASRWARERSGDWNLITSAGPAATQTVNHLHLDLVPRREGDGLKMLWSEA